MIYLLEHHYLLMCSAVAIIFAVWSRRDTWVWAILGFAMYLLWVNKSFFEITDITLYYTRAFIGFFTALIFLCFLTKFSIYQAFIQLLVLCSYGLVEYDTAQGTNLIYNNYEAVIYGLVASQYIAIFPELWTRGSNYYSSSFASSSDNKGVSSL